MSKWGGMPLEVVEFPPKNKLGFYRVYDNKNLWRWKHIAKQLYNINNHLISMFCVSINDNLMNAK